MNKNILAFICISLLVFGASQAFGGQGSYVGAGIGINLLNDSDVSNSPGSEIAYDPGIALGLTLGYDYGCVRMEGEIGYLKNDIDETTASGITTDYGGDVETWCFMLNLLYDFEMNTAFTPYAGGGIGFAQVDMNDLSFGAFSIGNDDDTVFAYQVQLGIGYAVSDTLMLDVNYRYFVTDDANLDESGLEIDYNSHKLSAGMRLSF